MRKLESHPDFVMGYLVGTLNAVARDERVPSELRERAQEAMKIALAAIDEKSKKNLTPNT